MIIEPDIKSGLTSTTVVPSISTGITFIISRPSVISCPVIPNYSPAPGAIIYGG